MAVNLGVLEMLLRIRDELTPQLGVVQRSLTQAGQQMHRAGMALLPLSAGIAAVGIGSVKMATDLNASLANVSALLTDLSGDTLTTTVASMKTQVQSLAVEMGKSTTDISGGLYEVISSLGFTKDTFGQLEIAAKAGAAGLATTQESFNFLSAVTKTYGDTSAEAFKKVADLGFQAVNFGQTTFPELASAIGGVAPIAKVAGVSLEEMFAVLATATGVTGSTNEVVTQMASALNALLAPSSDMEDAFQALGVASGQALIQQRGFVGALQAISQYAAATKTPMLDLLGRKEAFIITATLAGEQAGRFTELLGEMGEAAGASGAIVEAAFQKQTQGVNQAGFAWQQFKAELQVTAQQLGDVLLPILLQAANDMRPVWEAAQHAVSWFAQLPQPVQTVAVALGVMGAAAAPLLLVLGSLATGISSLIALWPLLVAGIKLVLPFLGPAGLIAAGVIAVLLAWKHWDQIVDIAKAVYNGIKTWLVDKFGWIVDGVKGMVDGVVGLFQRMYDTVVGQSIVPDMVQGVIEQFAIMEDGVLRVTESIETRTIASISTMARLMSAELVPAIEDAQASLGAYDLIVLRSADSIAEWQAATRAANAELARAGFLIDFAAHKSNNATAMITGASRATSTWREDLRRLGDDFAKLAQIANGSMTSILREIGSAVQSVNVFSTSLTSVKSGFTSLFSGGGLSNILGGITSVASGIGGIVTVASLAWQGISKLFGGPSAAEMEGRRAADEFRRALAAGLTEAQRAEVAAARAAGQNELWAGTVIAIRDAYIAAGRTEAEALAAADRLWRAEQQGGAAVRAVIEEIRRHMAEGLTQATNAATQAATTGFTAATDAVATNRLSIQELTSIDYEALRAKALAVLTHVHGLWTEVHNAALAAKNAVWAVIDALQNLAAHASESLGSVHGALTAVHDAALATANALNSIPREITTTIRTVYVTVGRPSGGGGGGGGGGDDSDFDEDSGTTRAQRTIDGRYYTPDEFRNRHFQHGTPGLDFMPFGRESLIAAHGDEAIVPRGGGHQLAGEIAQALGGRSGRMEIHVHTHLDGREVAHTIVPYWSRALASHGLA